MFEGKTVLVTGSSRGIGAAIAREFAAQGAHAIIHGRDADTLGDVQKEITAAGGTASAFAADLLKFEGVEAMRKEIEAQVGPVDVLVANAGGSFTPPAALEDIPEEGWHASINGNLDTTFLTLKSFLPGMKERGRGAIITIASSAGRVPHAQAPIPYGVAKAGIVMLTQDLAAQAGPSGIRVNCIAPETILTDSNQKRIPEAQQTAMAAAHPLKRLGTPADVAQAAIFLASDQSSWITGAVLDVTGGAIMV